MNMFANLRPILHASKMLKGVLQDLFHSERALAVSFSYIDIIDM